jgi:hypothetical protein
MLIMMNTTRPMTSDNSITVRYLCTNCGQWCSAFYDLKDMIWDENEATLDIDSDASEELYFVGRHYK